MRGSEWSRWDLHVHTPASLVQSYGADDDSTWDRFLTDLESLPPETAVIGINDYLEVEGYKRVQAERKSGRLQNLRLVLPVIEFRIARFSGQAQWQRVNFHVIFSDEVDASTIEQELLSSLNREYTLADGNIWSGPPLRDRLTELGRRMKQCAPPASEPASDLLVGFHNFNVEPADLKKVLERSDAFRGRYVTAVGMGEWNQMRWESSAAEKRSIVNSADFVLTAALTPADFDRARQSLVTNTVQSRLLHSSDAHYFSSSSEPNRVGRSLTWVKALPTFEGLLLARHEYEHRVVIGSEEPSQLRIVRESPTKFIRSVSFERVGGDGASWFDRQEVRLNPGLVAIIGNKGSGKSALADGIALVGNADVEEHLSFLSGRRFRDSLTGSASEFTCSIEWESGDSETRYLSEHIDNDKPERVRCLPQNYFERLCSDVGEDSFTEFERQLKRVVFSWLPLDRRLGSATLDELIAFTTTEWRERHRLRVAELVELNREVAALERALQPASERQLRSLRDEVIREREAHEAARPTPPVQVAPATAADDERSAEIEGLAVEISAADAQLQEAEGRLSGLRLARQRGTELEQRLDNIELYVSQQIRSAEATAALSSLGLSASDVLTLRVTRDPLRAKLEALDAAIGATVDLVDAARADRTAKRDARAALIRELDDEQRAARDAQLALQEWERRLMELTGDPATDGSVRFYEATLAGLPKQAEELALFEAARRQLLDDVFHDLAALRDSYRGMFLPIQEYLAQEPLLGNGLTMTVEAVIRDDGLAAELVALLDQSKRGDFYQGGDELIAQLIGAADFNSIEGVRAFVADVLARLRPVQNGRPVSDVDAQLRSRASREQAYDLLFGLSYLSPHYALRLNGKEIAQLSPGERGAALLVFYLLVDKSNIPIILDQPEENLDNETVSRLLVPAIRVAKERRQVVIVTHNPNLAVYCDADQVVLAEFRRDGPAHITYRSGAIEEAATRRWLVDVLEGTAPAFLKRHAKYSIGEDGGIVAFVNPEGET